MGRPPAMAGGHSQTRQPIHSQMFLTRTRLLTLALFAGVATPAPVTSASKNTSRLTLGGRLQVQYAGLSTDIDDADDPASNNTFAYWANAGMTGAFPGGGAVDKARESYPGGAYHFLGNDLKLQMGYVHGRAEDALSGADAVVRGLRSQLQLQF